MSDFESRLTAVLTQGAEDAPGIEGLASGARARARVRRRTHVAGVAAAAVLTVAGGTAILANLTGDGRATDPVDPAGPTTYEQCDPGGGFPPETDNCSDLTLETGWLTKDKSGQLRFEPFTMLSNGEEGRQYAAEHGLEYPFPNDYYDASTGEPQPFEIPDDAYCTGIMTVGYQEPLADHEVDCAAFGEVLQNRGSRVTSAVWLDGDTVVQVSELYRP